MRIRARRAMYCFLNNILQGTGKRLFIKQYFAGNWKETVCQTIFCRKLERDGLSFNILQGTGKRLFIKQYFAGNWKETVYQTIFCRELERDCWSNNILQETGKRLLIKQYFAENWKETVDQTIFCRGWATDGPLSKPGRAVTASSERHAAPWRRSCGDGSEPAERLWKTRSSTYGDFVFLHSSAASECAVSVIPGWGEERTRICRERYVRMKILWDQFIVNDCKIWMEKNAIHFVLHYFLGHFFPTCSSFI